jgi:hypothetical protein
MIIIIILFLFIGKVAKLTESTIPHNVRGMSIFGYPIIRFSIMFDYIVNDGEDGIPSFKYHEFSFH